MTKDQLQQFLQMMGNDPSRSRANKNDIANEELAMLMLSQYMDHRIEWISTDWYSRLDFIAADMLDKPKTIIGEIKTTETWASDASWIWRQGLFIEKKKVEWLLLAEERFDCEPWYVYLHSDLAMRAVRISEIANVDFRFGKLPSGHEGYFVPGRYWQLAYDSPTVKAAQELVAERYQ